MLAGSGEHLAWLAGEGRDPFCDECDSKPVSGCCPDGLLCEDCLEMTEQKDYFEDEALSASQLCSFIAADRRGTLEDWYLEYRCGQKRETTPAMQFGTTVHGTLELSTSSFVAGEKAVVWPEECLNKNGGIAGSRKETKEFRAANEGRLLIKPGERDPLEAIHKAVSENKIARQLLDSGQKEVPFYWEKDGIKRKALLDVLGEIQTGDGPVKVISDWKTHRDVSESAFCRHASEMLYPIRFAWYRQAVRDNLEEDRECIWTAIHNKSYYVRNYLCPPEVLDECDRIIENYIEKWRNFDPSQLNRKPLYTFETHRYSDLRKMIDDQ